MLYHIQYWFHELMSDLSAGFPIFLDFWYCLVVPEAAYVER